MKKSKEVRKLLRKKAKNIDWSDGLSFDSVLCNLACSGQTKVAIPRGKYVIMIGDTNSGKSFLLKRALAAAAHNPIFDDYALVYDDPEFSDTMDNEKLFGTKYIERVESAAYDKDGNPKNSITVEDFYAHARARFKAGPCIYVLDSQDALGSLYAQRKAEEQEKAKRKRDEGEESAKAKGSYGDGKAKYHSEHLRTLLSLLHKNGSILLMASQTRDNIGFGAMFTPKTHAGGHAIEFYAQVQMWTKRIKKLKKKAKGKELQVGILTQFQTKRSRLTGRDRTVTVPIYFDAGVDDIGSQIKWLVEWKHWKCSQGIIKAPELKFSGTEEELIHKVEEKNLERKLRLVVRKVWAEIERTVRTERKPRYESQPE